MKIKLKDLALELDQFGVEGKCIIIQIVDDEVNIATNVRDYHELDEIMNKGYIEFMNELIK